MATKVKNNLGAVRTLNTLGKNARAVQKNLRKVSTGERITSAEDDASGWGISERMREKIRSLDQANQNTQNDLAMMRTAEGAVANIVDTLRTLKQKAIDSANDSNTDEDRRIMQKEVDQFIDQIDDNALVTFNGKFLINGAMNGATSNTRYAFYNENLLFESDSFDTQEKTESLRNKSPGNQLARGNTMDLMELRYADTGELLGIEFGDTFEVVSTDTNGVKRITTGTVTQRNHSLFDIVGINGNVALTLAFTGDRFPALVANSSELDDSLHREGLIAVSPFGTTIPVVADKHGQPLLIPNPNLSTLVLYSATHVLGDQDTAQITNFKITISDASGNVKKRPTEALKYKLLQRSATAGDNGGLSNATNFHVGAGANQSMKVDLDDMRASALGLRSKDSSRTISISTRDDALFAIDVFDNAINSALDQITSIGAMEARLEYTIGNITTSTENVQASDSTNRDADMAREMINYTKDNVLLQAAQTMLAQANQDASSILGLLS